MGTTQHPDALLIAYLRGELPEGERRTVADHLAACGECSRALEDFRLILQDLGSSLPRPPEIHWGRYRAEVRQKLEARRQRSWTRQWLPWPVPVTLSAVAAGALLILALQTWVYYPANGDLALLEETVVASRLDLLRQYAVIERLDLWEDLDFVRRLDEVTPRRKG